MISSPDSPVVTVPEFVVVIVPHGTSEIDRIHTATGQQSMDPQVVLAVSLRGWLRATGNWLVGSPPNDQPIGSGLPPLVQGRCQTTGRDERSEVEPGPS